MNNDLEKALAGTDESLDFYLENEPTHIIRLHIAQIKQKAVISTDAGVLKQRILAALNQGGERYGN